MVLELLGDPNGGFISLRDDPNETGPGYLEVSPNLVQAGWDWGPCCTDGLALSGIDPGTTVLIKFAEFDNNANTAPIEGLTEWVVYSADGVELPLALEQDRRVRLRVPAVDPCVGDINEDGAVDVADLLQLLGTWGACP